METESEPCNVCGGTDSKLLDGFYYCIECGTQNTNVRETILEERVLADGTFAQSVKKRIVCRQKDGVEMSGEWYRWHTFNFIISGLAEELISLGAKPTFKIKLLWIWTRYIKKYQNKEELLMNKTSQDENDQMAFPSFMIEENSNTEEEQTPKDDSSKKTKCDIKDGSRRDIIFLSRGLIIAMLYIALNLDESDIQLSHLYRFIQEKHLDIININRFVPDNINVKKIPKWTNFLHSKLCNQHQVRALAMSLLRKLNLGTPIVPNLRNIIDNFLTELCLPNDMKPFIYSLMHLGKCCFLDINNKAKRYMTKMPDYEGTVMTYILVAIKIFFGLDDDYEMKLSDIINKINLEKDLPKSYKIGQYSEPSDRLFSFREWCNYLQFRKAMLSKHNMQMAERNGFDIDDYVYLEHMEHRPKHNEELPDQLSMEIINKLPQELNIGVISKDMFIPSLTPVSDYTDVIIDHCQDPDIKLLLAEDFKRYNLKYACEHLDLLDSNMDNIIKGVSKDRKSESKAILGTIVMKKAETQMVYVKNCENRNWMKTNPPTMEHVICDETDNNTNDKESDHGYDSETTSKDKDLDCIIDESLADSSKIDENVEGDKSVKDKKEIILEEDTNNNIFDDCFEDINFKEECEKDNFGDGNRNDNQIQNDEVPNEDFDRRSDISDLSDAFLPTFNPDTFDREKTIKELILHACKIHKIAIPAEYKIREPRKRKDKMFGNDAVPTKRSRKAKYEGKASVKELLSNYYNYLQTDFVSKVQQEMSLAVRNTELENQHLGQNNDLSNTNMQISFLERNSIADNGPDSPIISSERNSTIGPTDEQSIDLHITNKTDINDKTEEIDENLENTLFDPDEMKLEDVIPKGDPKFDEEKYEIDQLYLKVEDGEVDQDSFFDVTNDPEIDNILSKKIEECKLSNAFAKLKAEPKLKNCIKKKEESDSEDEIPLSAIKEEILLMEEMYRQEENYESLIKKENIPEYNYWIRHYQPDFINRSEDWHTKFDEELKENTPTSFNFVIQECASILNCSKFYLYKKMQNLEKDLICRGKTTELNCQNASNSQIEIFEESPE